MSRFRIHAGAWFTLVTFLVAELGTAPLSLAAPAAALPEIAARTAFHFELPAELGRIHEIHSGQGPAIIHIQEAHGNYESQKKIQGILHHLKESYGTDLVLLEGNAFPLEPELIRFFPDRPELTVEIAEVLAKEGIVSGPELFMAGEEDVRAYGIEELTSYVENGRAFRDVLVQREVSENFLREMEEQIERLTSPYLNRKLRGVLERIEDYEKRLIPFREWLHYLKGQAKKYLELDLEDARSQVEWPMLLRVYALERISRELDHANLDSERAAFLKEIRNIPGDTFKNVQARLSSPVSDNHLSYPETGELFERMMQQLPAAFDFAPYRNVTLMIGHMILQSELKGGELHHEIESLQNALIDKLARNEKEKRVAAYLRDHRLLERLMALELTPSDYEEVLSRKLRPSELAPSFLDLNDASRVRNMDFQHLPELDLLHDKALEFYRGVKERDGWMLENLERRLSESGAKHAVVITGGFHAGPFQDYLTRQGYSYALVTPAIQDFGGRESYVETGVEQFVDPFEYAASTRRGVDRVTTSWARQIALGHQPRADIGAVTRILSEALRAHNPQITDSEIRQAINGTTYVRQSEGLPSPAEVRKVLESSTVRSELRAVNRRDFLRGVAAGAGALALPFVDAGNAQAQDEELNRWLATMVNRYRRNVDKRLKIENRFTTQQEKWKINRRLRVRNTEAVTILEGAKLFNLTEKSDTGVIEPFGIEHAEALVEEAEAAGQTIDALRGPGKERLYRTVRDLEHELRLRGAVMAVAENVIMKEKYAFPPLRPDGTSNMLSQDDIRDIVLEARPLLLMVSPNYYLNTGEVEYTLIKGLVKMKLSALDNVPDYREQLADYRMSHGALANKGEQVELVHIILTQIGLNEPLRYEVDSQGIKVPLDYQPAKIYDVDSSGDSGYFRDVWLSGLPGAGGPSEPNITIGQIVNRFAARRVTGQIANRIYENLIGFMTVHFDDQPPVDLRDLFTEPAMDGDLGYIADHSEELTTALRNGFEHYRRTGDSRPYVQAAHDYARFNREIKEIVGVALIKTNVELQKFLGLEENEDLRSKFLRSNEKLREEVKKNPVLKDNFGLNRSELRNAKSLLAVYKSRKQDPTSVFLNDNQTSVQAYSLEQIEAGIDSGEITTAVARNPDNEDGYVFITTARSELRDPKALLVVYKSRQQDPTSVFLNDNQTSVQAYGLDQIGAGIASGEITTAVARNPENEDGYVFIKTENAQAPAVERSELRLTRAVRVEATVQSLIQNTAFVRTARELRSSLVSPEIRKTYGVDVFRGVVSHLTYDPDNAGLSAARSFAPDLEDFIAINLPVFSKLLARMSDPDQGAKRILDRRLPAVSPAGQAGTGIPDPADVAPILLLLARAPQLDYTLYFVGQDAERIAFQQALTAYAIEKLGLDISSLTDLPNLHIESVVTARELPRSVGKVLSEEQDPTALVDGVEDIASRIGGAGLRNFAKIHVRNPDNHVALLQVVAEKIDEITQNMLAVFDDEQLLASDRGAQLLAEMQTLQAYLRAA